MKLQRDSANQVSVWLLGPSGSAGQCVVFCLCFLMPFGGLARATSCSLSGSNVANGLLLNG